MKTVKLLVVIFNMGWAISAQNSKTTPDLSMANDANIWELKNRTLSIINHNTIHLDAKSGGGLLWLKDFNFSNGVIECDIKGEDAKGRSFVGIAFNGKDDINYDAIYFRPFNFNNEQKKNHSVQYIAQPKYTWSYLRNNFTGKYENILNKSINPEDWFHIKIIIKSGEIEVFVNHSKTPTLKVKQISLSQNGRVGFWVGNRSQGWFKNLEITKKE